LRRFLQLTTILLQVVYPAYFGSKWKPMALRTYKGEHKRLTRNKTYFAIHSITANKKRSIDFAQIVQFYLHIASSIHIRLKPVQC